MKPNDKLNKVYLYATTKKRLYFSYIAVGLVGVYLLISTYCLFAGYFVYCIVLTINLSILIKLIDYAIGMYMISALELALYDPSSYPNEIRTAFRLDELKELCEKEPHLRKKHMKTFASSTISNLMKNKISSEDDYHETK